MSVNDLKPLMTASTVTSASNRDSEAGTLDVARIWPCRYCGMLLGILHLVPGVTLLIFDVVTNNISETAFAITAALSFIVCAIFAFISVRRLDRAAQLLLLFFSLFAMAMSATMFIESASVINENCDRSDCYSIVSNVHVILMCFGLVEFTISIVTIVVCFRSLRKAYRVRKASSPYSTLIEGHYDAFYIEPRTINDRKNDTHMLQYLIKK